jgi:hypothetical protein
VDNLIAALTGGEMKTALNGGQRQKA